MRGLVLVLMAAIALAMVLFGAQNTEAVSVRFLWLDSGRMSLSLVMVLAAVAGAALVALLWLWDQVRFGLRQHRMGRQVNSLAGRAGDLEKRLASAEAENATLREQVALLGGHAPDYGPPASAPAPAPATAPTQSTHDTTGPR
ncbi:MAG: DUF1049 domain-containing protein [Chloroflexi bacterium]|nr:DUF1049 domain-containing protein [Chloroflexota bacterium]